MEKPETPGYIVRHFSDVVPTPCPCGSSVRIFTSDDTPEASFHVTRITDSRRHYHKNTTEFYYILSGHGVLEIGDDSVELRPGLGILIKKGVPHRGSGDFEAIIVPVPAFDPEDEYLVD
ncbi:MAG: cupin domain-containing protein [Spirochaetaceae bacterium]|nr:MAG: cupin domain-containing protein [Spirochaetaceae bacterium]